MAPAAGLKDSGNSSSADVFGNDLEDVDVWCDFAAGPTDEDIHGKVVHEAIEIAERSASGSQGVPKPRGIPRTPQVRRKNLHMELLIRQKSLTPTTNSTPGRQLRRSTGSESDLMGSKRIMHAQNQLPRMTPRTRMRKLGLVPPAAPQPEPSPRQRPKPPSVAEKRRRKSENLSAIALNCQFDGDDSGMIDFCGGSDGNLAFEPDADSSGNLFGFPVEQKQQAADILDDFVRKRRDALDGKIPLTHVRGYSDGAVFNPHESSDSQQNVVAVSTDANEIQFVPPGMEKTADTEKKPEVIESPRPSKPRESRSDRDDSHNRRRSASAKRRNQPRRGCRQSSHFSSGAAHAAPEPTPPKTQRAPENDAEMEDGMDNLQSHLKALLQGEAPPSPRSGLRASSHSNSTKSQRSNNSPRRGRDSLNDQDEEKKRPSNSPRRGRNSLHEEDDGENKKRSSSRRRRGPAKSLSNNSEKEFSSARRGSIRSSNSDKDSSDKNSNTPRAGQKIKFVRRTDSGNEDGTDTKSTRSGKSRVSRTGSYKSSRSGKSSSSKPTRRSSMDNSPTSPRPVTPTKERPHRSRSDMSPSPGLRNRTEDKRNSEPKSPAPRRKPVQDMKSTPRATPNRRIKYVSQSPSGSGSGEGLKSAIPPLGL